MFFIEFFYFYFPILLFIGEEIDENNCHFSL